jgi:phosphate-selective porin OprO/OprP
LTNLSPETITVRGRIGFKGSVDGAMFNSGHGQREVDSVAEVRTLRFYTTGEFGVIRTNEYKLDLGFSGGSFYLHEASFRYPQLPYIGNFTFGYFGVPQTIDNIVSFGSGSFMEAASPGLAFNPGDRIGLQLDRTFFEQRMTVAFGLFSLGQKASLNFGDASESLARPTLRVTGLIIDQPDQHRFLHLGGSASFVFSDSSDIRYQARPESHLAPVLVDTGLLAAQFAYVGGLELIYQEGPFTLQSEVMGTVVDGDQSNLFWGTYASAGWLLTGEHRSYDRTAGLQGRVRPNSPLSLSHHGWGALEMACRYSYLDLADGLVRGGRMNILMPGVNWYWNEHIRWLFNYGFAHVVEGPSPGNLNIFQLRLQWLY